MLCLPHAVDLEVHKVLRLGSSRRALPVRFAPQALPKTRKTTWRDFLFEERVTSPIHWRSAPQSTARLVLQRRSDPSAASISTCYEHGKRQATMLLAKCPGNRRCRGAKLDTWESTAESLVVCWHSIPDDVASHVPEMR